MIAKRNFCVPAVLQMLLEHHGIHGFSQERIAEQLVIIPDDNDIDHSTWGTQITNNTLNCFFKNNNIPLRERFIRSNIFIDEFYFEDEICELLKSNFSIICGFNYTTLFGNSEDTYRHVSIITDVNKGIITLLDPGPKNSGYKEVSSYKLLQAINMAKDGLWCITSLHNCNEEFVT